MNARIFSYLTIVGYGTAFALLMVYEYIGAWVDEAGVLHEPFYLIPLAWLSFFLGTLALLGWIIGRQKAKHAAI